MSNFKRVKTDVLVEDLYSNETVQSQAREIGNIISAHDDLLFKESYKKKFYPYQSKIFSILLLILLKKKISNLI